MSSTADDDIHARLDAAIAAEVVAAAQEADRVPPYLREYAMRIQWLSPLFAAIMATLVHPGFMDAALAARVLSNAVIKSGMVLWTTDVDVPPQRSMDERAGHVAERGEWLRRRLCPALAALAPGLDSNSSTRTDGAAAPMAADEHVYTMLMNELMDAVVVPDAMALQHDGVPAFALRYWSRALVLPLPSTVTTGVLRVEDVAVHNELPGGVMTRLQCATCGGLDTFLEPSVMHSSVSTDAAVAPASAPAPSLHCCPEPFDSGDGRVRAVVALGWHAFACQADKERVLIRRPGHDDGRAWPSSTRPPTPLPPWSGKFRSYLGGALPRFPLLSSLQPEALVTVTLKDAASGAPIGTVLLAPYTQTTPRTPPAYVILWLSCVVGAGPDDLVPRVSDALEAVVRATRASVTLRVHVHMLAGEDAWATTAFPGRRQRPRDMAHACGFRAHVALPTEHYTESKDVALWLDYWPAHCPADMLGAADMAASQTFTPFLPPVASLFTPPADIQQLARARLVPRTGAVSALSLALPAPLPGTVPFDMAALAALAHFRHRSRSGGRPDLDQPAVVSILASSAPSCRDDGAATDIGNVRCPSAGASDDPPRSVTHDAGSTLTGCSNATPARPSDAACAIIRAADMHAVRAAMSAAQDAGHVAPESHAQSWDELVVHVPIVHVLATAAARAWTRNERSRVHHMPRDDDAPGELGGDVSDVSDDELERGATPIPTALLQLLCAALCGAVATTVGPQTLALALARDGARAGVLFALADALAFCVAMVRDGIARRGEMAHITHDQRQAHATGHIRANIVNELARLPRGLPPPGHFPELLTSDEGDALRRWALETPTGRVVARGWFVTTWLAWPERTTPLGRALLAMVQPALLPRDLVLARASVPESESGTDAAQGLTTNAGARADARLRAWFGLSHTLRVRAALPALPGKETARLHLCCEDWASMSPARRAALHRFRASITDWHMVRRDAQAQPNARNPWMEVWISEGADEDEDEDEGEGEGEGDGHGRVIARMSLYRAGGAVQLWNLAVAPVWRRNGLMARMVAWAQRALVRNALPLFAFAHHDILAPYDRLGFYIVTDFLESAYIALAPEPCRTAARACPCPCTCVEVHGVAKCTGAGVGAPPLLTSPASFEEAVHAARAAAHGVARIAVSAWANDASGMSDMPATSGTSMAAHGTQPLPAASDTGGTEDSARTRHGHGSAQQQAAKVDEEDDDKEETRTRPRKRRLVAMGEA